MDGGMIFYKYLAAAVVLALIIVIVELGRVGRKIAAERRVSGRINADLLRHHQSMGNATLCVAGVAIGLIELMVRLSPHPYVVSPWLYWFNIASGAGFVGLFVAIFFRWNGQVYPRLHAKLVYTGMALFVVSLATGVPMLVRLPL